MVFFDSETYTSSETSTELRQELKLFTAVYVRYDNDINPRSEVWTHGYEANELALFILSHLRKKICLNIFSANIWFDIRVTNLLENLIKAGFKISMYFVSGKCFIMKLKRALNSIRFINIQNIFPISVQKIGEAIGLAKLDVDFKTVSDKDLLIYCKRDTEIIYKAITYWLKFIRYNDLGTFGVTIASQAFNAYRHRFMPANIMIHANAKISDLERKGYFGGRTECFFIGELKNRKVYMLDINAQYPFVMREHEFPYSLKYHTKNTTPEKLYKLTKYYAVMVTCELNTDQPIYPVKCDSKTIFPVGRFVTTLCTGSFKLAFESGHISSIHEASVYCKGKIFEKWVNNLFKIKAKYLQENNTTMIFLVKRIMNCLYGKFGQRSDELISSNDNKELGYYSERYFDLDNSDWYMISHVGNYEKVIKTKCKEAFHSFPAISAHVTDYARVYLWKLMSIANLDNLYYIDTDSLYVNHTGYKNLKSYIHKTELGKLKLEKTVTYLNIKGLKDYIAGTSEKIKGIPKLAKKLTDNSYECQIFPGLNRDIQKGMNDHYSIEKVIKHLERRYTKGKVLSTGRVIPFSLPVSSHV